MSVIKLTPDHRLADSRLLADGRLIRALDILNPPGEETRIVGGAVRNALLGHVPGDIDMATTMRPDIVQACAKAARIRCVPTGIDHGTVTLLVKGLTLEVTTLREDVETDGRHAVVRFGRDFLADARRRDFTINALSLAPDGEVFDPVGGITDLAEGRVRFIGDATTRIREDYLRILRFFRFHASYGRGPLDPAGLAAATAERQGIVHVSRERIRTELIKTLAAREPSAAVDAMAASGILAMVLGAEADLGSFAAAMDIERTPPDPIMRLAALAVRGNDDVARLRCQLRLTNAEQARLLDMLSARADMSECPEAPQIRRLLFDHGHAAVLDALVLGYAMGLAPRQAPRWRDTIEAATALPRPQLPWTGVDLKARGLSGPPVGAALAELRRRWAGAGFPQSPDILWQMLDEVASRLSGQSAG